MDAQDIFRKLCRGVTFGNKAKKRPAVQLNNGIPKKELKEEPVAETNDHVVDSAASDDEFEDKRAVKSIAGGEKSVSLLRSMRTAEEISEARGKKRKHRGILSKTLNDGKLKEMLYKEEVNHYRNLNRINVVGKNVPEPAKSFDDFNVGKDLIDNLKNCDYVEPTPIQKQAVPILVGGRPLLACAPTGSGKTAAFLVPIINDLQGPEKVGYRALILCPTRELAKQIQRECIRLSEGRNLRAHVITKIRNDLSKRPFDRKNIDILISTPNRLCYLLKQEPPAISLAKVEWLIIDEADKLFETGVRGFRDQLDQVLAACTNEDKNIAMFSATFMPVVAKWCVRNMKGLIRVTVGHKNTATDQVDQELLFVGNEDGKKIALHDLIRKGVSPPCLIFVQSKDRAQQLFNELVYDGIHVDAIHGDRTQTQRDNTVKAFREGKIWFLICTEVMARGIDFKGVNMVINYDFPPSSISYIHRVGRAGRAGRRGKAVTYFTKEDTVNLRSIAHIVKDSGCEVPEYLLTLKKQSKKAKKKLKNRAPKRRDITVRPHKKIRLGKEKKSKQKKGPKREEEDSMSD